MLFHQEETLSKGGDGPAVIPAAGAELPLFTEE
jgi:hypothetical protein